MSNKTPPFSRINSTTSPKIRRNSDNRGVESEPTQISRSRSNSAPANLFGPSQVILSSDASEVNSSSDTSKVKSGNIKYDFKTYIRTETLKKRVLSNKPELYSRIAFLEILGLKDKSKIKLPNKNLEFTFNNMKIKISSQDMQLLMNFIMYNNENFSEAVDSFAKFCYHKYYLNNTKNEFENKNEIMSFNEEFFKAFEVYFFDFINNNEDQIRSSVVTTFCDYYKINNFKSSPDPLEISEEISESSDYSMEELSMLNNLPKADKLKEIFNNSSPEINKIKDEFKKILHALYPYIQREKRYCEEPNREPLPDGNHVAQSAVSEYLDGYRIKQSDHIGKLTDAINCIKNSLDALGKKRPKKITKDSENINTCIDTIEYFAIQHLDLIKKHILDAQTFKKTEKKDSKENVSNTLAENILTGIIFMINDININGIKNKNNVQKCRFYPKHNKKQPFKRITSELDSWKEYSSNLNTNFPISFREDTKPQSNNSNNAGSEKNGLSFLNLSHEINGKISILSEDDYDSINQQITTLNKNDGNVQSIQNKKEIVLKKYFSLLLGKKDLSDLDKKILNQLKNANDSAAKNLIKKFNEGLSPDEFYSYEDEFSHIISQNLDFKVKEELEKSAYMRIFQMIKINSRLTKSKKTDGRLPVIKKGNLFNCFLSLSKLDIEKQEELLDYLKIQGDFEPDTIGFEITENFPLDQLFYNEDEKIKREEERFESDSSEDTDLPLDNLENVGDVKAKQDYDDIKKIIEEIEEIKGDVNKLNEFIYKHQKNKQLLLKNSIKKSFIDEWTIVIENKRANWINFSLIAFSYLNTALPNQNNKIREKMKDIFIIDKKGYSHSYGGNKKTRLSHLFDLANKRITIGQKSEKHKNDKVLEHLDKSINNTIMALMESMYKRYIDDMDHNIFFKFAKESMISFLKENINNDRNANKEAKRMLNNWLNSSDLKNEFEAQLKSKLNLKNPKGN